MFGFGASDTPRKGGLFARARAILAIVIRMAQNRIALVATGLREEYEQMWPLLIQTLISFVLVSFGLFFLSVFIVVLFWDTHRLAALALTAFIFLASGSFVAFNVNHQWAKRQKGFSTILEELEKDIQSLQD